MVHFARRGRREDGRRGGRRADKRWDGRRWVVRCKSSSALSFGSRGEGRGNGEVEDGVRGSGLK